MHCAAACSSAPRLPPAARAPPAPAQAGHRGRRRRCRRTRREHGRARASAATAGSVTHRGPGLTGRAGDGQRRSTSHVTSLDDPARLTDHAGHSSADTSHPPRPGLPRPGLGARGAEAAGAAACYVFVMPAGAPWSRARAGSGGSEDAGQPDRRGPARSGDGGGCGLRRRGRRGGHRGEPVRRRRARPRPAAGARRRGLREPGGRAVARPDPDAHRGRGGRGPGGRAQPGRRRLPAQAVRVHRAGRPGPGPVPAEPVHPAGAHPGRPDRGPGPAPGQPGQPAAAAHPEGVRRARGACSARTARW